jgi:hypothetical protein
MNAEDHGVRDVGVDTHTVANPTVIHAMEVNSLVQGVLDVPPSNAWHTADKGSLPTQSIKGAMGLSSSIGSKSPFLPTKPSREDVIAFGGIQDPAKTAPRSSERVRAQPNADASQMERATTLAQHKNDLPGSGIKQKSSLSFVSFSEKDIVAKATSLGVSLGSSTEQVSKSVSTIKNLELQRNVVFLKNNLGRDVDEEQHSLVLSRATNLCEDLDDEDDEFLGDTLGPLSKNSVVPRARNKKKEMEVRVPVRRSARIFKIQKRKR